MTFRQRTDICQLLQWVAIIVAIIAGVYVIIAGEFELGIGVIAAALSSSHVVTNRLPNCTVTSERRISSPQVTPPSRDLGKR